MIKKTKIIFGIVFTILIVGLLQNVSLTKNVVNDSPINYDRLVQAQSLNSNLNYSSYFGNLSCWDQCNNIKCDSSGNVILLKGTNDSTLPTTPGVYDTSHNGDFDLYVSKWTPDMKTLLWATYIGGSADDTYEGMNLLALDSSDNIYISSVSTSSNFPMVNNPRTYQGGSTVYILKLSSNGSTLIYSTFIGRGSVRALCVDSTNRAVLVGFSWLSYYATAGAYQTSRAGNSDGFLTRMSASGSVIEYSTFLGGSAIDTISGVTVYGNDIYLAGTCAGASFTGTPGCYDSSFGGIQDIFLMKFSVSSNKPLNITYLGGSGSEDMSFCELKINYPYLYFSGNTNSVGFIPTTGGYDTSVSDYDEFICKMDLNLSTVYNFTLFGGSGADFASDYEIRDNHIYLYGCTTSTDLVTTPTAIQTIYGGNQDGFIFVFDEDLTTLEYSTYLGGNQKDTINYGCFNLYNQLMVVGGTLSTNFPITADALDSVGDGTTYDGFISTLNLYFTVPSAPTLQLNGENPSTTGSYELTWNSVDGADNYSLFQQTGSPIVSISSMTPIYSGTGYSFTETNHPNGTYYYRVIATNETGNSALSNEISEQVIITFKTPSAPGLNLIGNNPNYNNLYSLSWNSVDGADNYSLYQQSGTPIISISEMTPIYSGTEFSFTETNRPNGTYYYRVIATNETGNSQLSNEISVQVISIFSIPQAPTLNLNGLNPNPNGSYSLTWNAVNGADNYSLYQQSGTPIISISEMTPIYSGTEFSFTETNRPNGTYYYRVIATNETGNSQLSNEVSVLVKIETFVPSAPILQIVGNDASSTGTYNITWNSVNGANNYSLYRDTSSITTMDGKVPLYSGNALIFTEYNLSNGTYHYRAIATNETGNSALSAEVSVVVSIPPKPTNGLWQNVSSGVSELILLDEYGVVRMVVNIISTQQFQIRLSYYKNVCPLSDTLNNSREYWGLETRNVNAKTVTISMRLFYESKNLSTSQEKALVLYAYSNQWVKQSATFDINQNNIVQTWNGETYFGLKIETTNSNPHEDPDPFAIPGYPIFTIFILCASCVMFLVLRIKKMK